MNEDEKEAWEACKYHMGEEGFHYCFESYSSWKEIKDAHFHKLRNAYLKSARLLKEYINEKAKEDF